MAVQWKVSGKPVYLCSLCFVDALACALGALGFVVKGWFYRKSFLGLCGVLLLNDVSLR